MGLYEIHKLPFNTSKNIHTRQPNRQVTYTPADRDKARNE